MGHYRTCGKELSAQTAAVPIGRVASLFDSKRNSMGSCLHIITGTVRFKRLQERRQIKSTPTANYRGRIHQSRLPRPSPFNRKRTPVSDGSQCRTRGAFHPAARHVST